MSTVFKALADPTRRKVLALLKEGPMSAGAIAEHFDISKPTMSGHFAVLREAGLVTSERDGKQVVYALQLSVLEDAMLGFAAAFGWKLEESGQQEGREIGNPDLPAGLSQEEENQ